MSQRLVVAATETGSGAAPSRNALDGETGERLILLRTNRRESRSIMASESGEEVLYETTAVPEIRAAADPPDRREQVEDLLSEEEGLVPGWGLQLTRSTTPPTTSSPVNAANMKSAQ